MDSTFLGQGSYGCIYKTKLKCIDQQNSSKHLPHNVLSKIYSHKKYATREIMIGKYITQIPNYEQYFSPVLQNCNASLAEIHAKDIEKCNLISGLSRHPKEDEEPTYYTTTTKYIKGQTLSNYLNTYKKTHAHIPHTIDNKIFYIYTCLINSITELNSHNIIHFDLSEQNIIMDTTDRPIIIDFGMSITPNKIKTVEEFKYEFGHYKYRYTNSPTKKGQLDLYDPWCVEIIILLHLNSTPSDSTPSDTSTIILNEKHIENIKSLSDSYINLLQMEKKHFTQDEIAKYKESKNTLYETLIGKTAYEASQELLKTSIHWDKYAITMICLKHLSETNNPTTKKQQMIEKIKGIALLA